MDYYTIVGLVVVALIALSSVVLQLRKSAREDLQPIEDLNLNIVKLNANFEHMMKSDEIRDKRIEKHGVEIDRLVERQKDNEKTLLAHDIKLKNIEDKLE